MIDMTDAKQTAGGITGATPPALIYRGARIHERREMLSLTDMWKVSGSDPSKQPAKWRELPSSRMYASHVSVILRYSEDALFDTSTRRSGTWAHWQIALAYAKYLSPEFHMWCNTVVRERMEGRPLEGRAAAGPFVYDAREARLSFKHHLSVAKMLKLEGAQALIAANNATKALVGIDMLGVMKITHVTAPQNEQLLNVTEIGKRLDGISARDTNAYLCQFGYQVAFRDARGDLYYEPTKLGRESGGVLQDTGKRNTAGVPVRQLRWASGIVARLREDIDGPKTVHG
jgi:hypothetical protein